MNRIANAPRRPQSAATVRARNIEDSDTQNLLLILFLVNLGLWGWAFFAFLNLWKS